jgi:FlgD Ig-like domain
VSRLSVTALATLVTATVAAFFFVQHRKVTTPFFSGSPRVDPAYINPLEGGVCRDKSGERVSFRRTRVSFYLVHRADHVNMYIVNSQGQVVRTIATDRYMPRATIAHPDQARRLFVWNGRADDGSIASDGTYYFRVALINQGRALDVGGPITVQTTPPHPDVTNVTPQVTTGGQSVAIHFRGNEGFRSEVLIYRTDLPGAPRLVYKFATKYHPDGFVTWDGEIDGSPAPAGTYLIGLRTTDKACTTNAFPVLLPPQPGTTPHAGVTVRYLAAAPPLTPIAAGQRATVEVDSRGRPYSWSLALPGARKPLSHGSGTSVALYVRLPKSGPGLYILYLNSRGYRTAVPLVASAAPAHHVPQILVVLPALTWQGQNPVDDVGSNPYDGDGLPNTLTAGVPIPLTNRVFADGLPAGLGDIEGLLAYLNKERLSYDLTTDLGLAEGVGPALNSYRGIVLAGDEMWLPDSLRSNLRAYAQGGGNVLSLGIGSLLRTVTLQDGEALHPSAPASVDAFGVRIGSVQRVNGLIGSTKDDLRIFSTSETFQGYSEYQPFTVPGGPQSEAGFTTNSPAIVGFHSGRGTVVEVGLVGFGSSLRTNVNAQELISRLWQVLAR